MRRKRGTTLVEILVSLVFLSLAIGPMVACVSQAQSAALNAQERYYVLGKVRDVIEAQRANALGALLTTGTTTTTANGIWTPVTITTTIAGVSGYSDLYSVDVKATWGNATIPNRGGTIEIITYMRGLHV